MENITMKQTIRTAFITLALLTSATVFASPATDELFARYKSEGAANFNAEQGKTNWNKTAKGSEGEEMTCHKCHGEDLTKDGKHHKTNKVIKPMAPSVNPDRFTDVKKIEKWFKRNCNDAWGRECTAQEKGDILKFLLSK
jgi:hypothetical protein